MPTIPNHGKPLVLLTGASGFCGAWIAHALLQNGYTVCGVVRSDAKGQHLSDVYSASGLGSGFSFEIVQDTSKPGALDTVLQKREPVAIVHTAAVVGYDNNITGVLETNAEAIDYILESVHRHGSKVKRFIYLGSVQALLEKDGKPRGYIFKETDWYQSAVDAVKANKPGISGEQLYAASKTIAEQKIVRFEEEHPNLPWDITRLLPPYVFGKLLHRTSFADPSELNYSMKLIYKWLTSPPSPDVFPFQMGYNFWAADFVDVQDLGKIFVRTLQAEGAGGKRIIVNAEAFSYQDFFNTVADLGLEGPRGTPESALRLLPNKSVDDSTARDILGWTEYTPLASCVKDCYESLEKSGLRISSAEYNRSRC